jgi:serine/threonine protein kinase
MSPATLVTPDRRDAHFAPPVTGELSRRQQAGGEVPASLEAVESVCSTAGLSGTGGQPTVELRGVHLPHAPGYEVLEVLGRGGMGVVFKARQTALDRIVALKMIRHAEYASPEERQRFRAEAEAMARLQHPHVAQVHEVGEAGGLLYFSLEYCGGGTLADKLAGTPWEAMPAARLVEVLARAVHAAHQKGIVHRDLKPANVLLAEDGTIKVTDFGLAKWLPKEARAPTGPEPRGPPRPGWQTQTGAVLGTPNYMAPEQARGQKEVGPAADVWALGAILYQLLTGRPPFNAATPMDTILQVLSQEPVAVRSLQPRAPRDLETICHKCLEKDPARRYASAEALAEDLRRFAGREPILARPVGRLGRWRGGRGARRWWRPCWGPSWWSWRAA